MWGFKSYTDEFYVLEIQKENMKVINHFHTYCRDYFRKTYKKLFQEENLEDDFFQESFVKLGKRSGVVLFLYKIIKFTREMPLER